MRLKKEKEYSFAHIFWWMTLIYFTIIFSTIINFQHSSNYFYPNLYYVVKIRTYLLCTKTDWLLPLSKSGGFIFKYLYSVVLVGKATVILTLDELGISMLLKTVFLKLHKTFQDFLIE